MLFGDRGVLLVTLLLHESAGKPLLKTVAHLPHSKDSITRFLMGNAQEEPPTLKESVPAAWLWPMPPARTTVVNLHKAAPEEPVASQRQPVSTVKSICLH